MHINDSNATERLSEKTDHGSMRFGHIRDNVHAVRPNRLPQFRFASHHFEFLNRDYINQKDSRPTVGRFIGRSSADLSADKMPDFSSFFIGRQKINYNYLVIIFFPSADSFGVLAIGRRSADGRPTIGR